MPAVTLICEHCATPFQVKPYRVGTARFCSLRCKGQVEMAARANPGKHFEKGNTLRAGLRPANALTPERSRELQAIRWPDNAPVERICLQCAVLFTIARWRLRRPGVTGDFCSVACLTAWRQTYASGANAPDWIGGPVTYRGADWPQVRLRVVIEQCGHCAHCNRYVGYSLPIDHIRRFRDFDSAAEANHRDNLIGLCPPCHMRSEGERLAATAANRRRVEATAPGSRS